MQKLFACLCAGLVMSLAPAAQAETYKFKVNNKTSHKIVNLLVSEDGSTWRPFDLGGGIGPSSTATMEWNESTNDESCEQQVKAVYDDKSESEAATFDFCEADLDLDFE